MTGLFLSRQRQLSRVATQVPGVATGVGLVLGHDLNFWVATEVFQRGKEMAIATGLVTGFGLGLGHLGLDRNFVVVTGPWGSWMVFGHDLVFGSR